MLTISGFTVGLQELWFELGPIFVWHVSNMMTVKSTFIIYALISFSIKNINVATNAQINYRRGLPILYSA